MRRFSCGFVKVCLVFAVAVATGAGPAVAAEPAAAPFDPLAEITAALGSPVKVTATIEVASDGGPDRLAVTAALEEGWHLYAVTQKPGGPRPTTITIASDSPRAVVGPFVPDAPPTQHSADDVPAWKGLVLEEHAGTVTWRAPLGPGDVAEVRGSVSLQLCRDNACVPPETIPFTARAGDVAASAAGARHAVERSHASAAARLQPVRTVDGTPALPLVIEITPETGWHVYKPAATAESGIGQGKPTLVAAAAGATIRSVTAAPFAVPVAAELATSGAVEGPVVLEVLLAPPADGSAAEVIVGLQTCSDTACDPPTAVRITARPPAVEFTAASYADAAAAPQPLALAAAAPPAADVVVGRTGPRRLTLPLALLMGLAGGLILNLMPCVLPVLGLKLMSFAQQSGRARREVFEMNLWYCAGLFAVFFVLATASVAANIGLAGSNLAWGEQFTSVGFNVTMVAVVFAFALSFLGIWELPIPGFIGEQAGHVQSREGPAGAFLKGVLSTVLATPCSGPFLGPVFGFTLTQSTAVTYAVFGAIATGMALPYVVVGLVPGLVKFLPRPGAWMGTFKEVLGFVMLGTVVYLFTFLDHVWFVPTLALLVGIWAGCWWVGRAQERLGGTVGFGRWVQAATIATAIGSAAFMFLGPVKSVIEWEEPFTRARLAELRDRGATVMVDFSADWCPTCKFNLATAIETDKVRSVVERNRVVPVLADWTDGSPEIKQMLESLDSKSIPVLAIFPGGKQGEPRPEPIVLRDLITESQVIEALERAGPSCCPPPEIRAASAQTAPGGR